MTIGVGGSAKAIFDQIEILFVDHVGPIAAVLTQEAMAAWVKQLKEDNQKPSLRNISGYIKLLVNEISDPDDSAAFINSVYEIKALVHYKQLYHEG